MSSRLLILTVLFIAFLYPLSMGGISVNYSYLLVPFAIAAAHGRLRFPGQALVAAIAVFALVYFAASLYQVDFLDESGRRMISFLIFMSIFGFAFVEVDEGMVTAFKHAVIAISIGFSLVSGYLLLSLGVVKMGFSAKDLVGSQRFGFIYVLAFWLAYADERVKRTLGITRYAVLAVLSAGLLLTFSRASVVAILATFGLYALGGSGAWLSRLNLRGLLRAFAAVTGLALLIVILYQVFPTAFDFFDERLFGLIGNADAVESHLEDQNSSEGTRLELARQTIEFVSRNPFTGAGFLGVWILPNAPENSAHNQYLDVLFRTGLLGFGAYLYLLLAVVRVLWRRQRPMFWGFFGVLVYGLFHETFKESQGACVLAFLIGMTAQASRERRAHQRPPEPSAAPMIGVGAP